MPAGPDAVCSHNPLLIYSTARCGSSSLARALNCHPDVRLAFEPFNNKRRTPFAEELPVKWGWKLDRLVKRVLADHSGLKHVWDPSGWPLGRSLNRRLLTRRWAMVVFLRRRNLLRQAVSNFMGLQSGVFHPEDRESAVESPEYQNIRVLGLERFIAGSLREREVALGWLKRSGNPYVELWYEDLFGEALNREDRHRVLEEVMNRMGLSLDAEGVDLERVATLLDPVSTKMNSSETYRSIPNVDEIEAELGSDSTGWLFKSL